MGEKRLLKNKMNLFSPINSQKIYSPLRTQRTQRKTDKQNIKLLFQNSFLWLNYLVSAHSAVKSVTNL